MLKFVFSFVLILATVYSGFAQNNLSSKLSNKSRVNIERLILPIFNNSQLRANEKIRFESEGAPHTFARSHKTHISPNNSGRWEADTNDQLTWTIIIKSPGAFSINLGFTKFLLPESARLYIYSTDQSTSYGPFTSDDNDDHGQFWTPLLEGDEIVMTLSVSSKEKEQLQLELTYVNHDFTGFGKAVLSGSCNLDVICGAGDGWPEVDAYRDIIRSAGAYFFQSPNGTSICSGALINNTRQDCTPYFLTANHCGINQNNAASMVFVWNYQNSDCRQPNSGESGQPGDGQKTQFNSGAILRAGFEDSDMTLVEMDDAVDPEFKPFFSGWNADSTLPGSTICVHHPGVTEKRISFDYDAATFDEDTHIRVLDWDIGTTEGGSSGSPLFNSKKEIVGQLTGGFAACGNDEYDSFGWLHRSWEGGGTSSTRLKDWLDPDNQGVLKLGGRDCGFSASLSETSVAICVEDNTTYSFSLNPNEFVDTTVYISFLSLPGGIMASSDKDSLISDDIATITLSNLDELNSGTYHLSIFINSYNDSTIVYIRVDIITGLPEVSILNTPDQGASNVHIKPVFLWTSNEDNNWDFELSSDPSFQNIVEESKNLSKPRFNLIQDLETESNYYWRIKTTNFCGSSEWSEVFTFSTGKIRCFEIFANDLPIGISENDIDTIYSRLFVPNGGTITDLEVVGISGTHSWSQDLRFTLIGPQGEKVIILSEECGSNEDFNFNIDDEASLNNVTCPLDQGFTYQTNGSLSVFDGQNPRGHWLLEVMDLAAFDGGELQSWALNLCLDVNNDFSVFYYPEELGSCGEDQLLSTIFVGAGFLGDVSFQTLSNPEEIVHFEPNPASPGESVTMTISNVSVLATGSYTFSYTASDGTNTTEESVTFSVNNGPGQVNLLSPSDLSQNIDLQPSFSWEVLSGVEEYVFELSSNPDFETLLDSVVISGTTYSNPGDLDELTQYYWRVSASNICGTSFSEVFAFETTMSSSILELGANRINIFPNPVSDYIHIFFETGFPDNLQIKLLNLEGKILINNAPKNGAYHSQMNVSHLSTGIYFLQLKQGNLLVTEKLIIQ